MRQSKFICDIVQCDAKSSCKPRIRQSDLGTQFGHERGSIVVARWYYDGYGKGIGSRNVEEIQLIVERRHIVNGIRGGERHDRTGEFQYIPCGLDGLFKIVGNAAIHGAIEGSGCVARIQDHDELVITCVQRIT